MASLSYGKLNKPKLILRLANLHQVKLNSFTLKKPKTARNEPHAKFPFPRKLIENVYDVCVSRLARAVEITRRISNSAYDLLLSETYRTEIK